MMLATTNQAVNAPEISTWNVLGLIRVARSHTSLCAFLGEWMKLSRITPTDILRAISELSRIEALRATPSVRG